MRRISLLLLILAIAAPLAGAVEPLASISAIRALSPEEAALNHPVTIEALVTYHHSAQPALLAYDGKEGIYVALPAEATGTYPLGTRVRIEGVTQPGGFLPIIRGSRISILGAESLPQPRRIDAGELFSPSLDCQWVQTPAIITGLEQGERMVLSAEVSGWTVKLLLPYGDEMRDRAAQFMQRPVTVTGVVGTVFNEQRQLTGRHFFIPSFDQIVPSEVAAPDGQPKLRAINELLRSDATSRTRVRVRAVVTHATDDSVYLRGEGGSVQVRTTDAGKLNPGTHVEAEGFAAAAPFRPVLRATRVSPLDKTAPPRPEPLALAGGLLSTQHAELVTVDADLLALRDGPGEQLILQCRTGDRFFEAFYPGSGSSSLRLDSNDRVRLTGICEFTTSRDLPFSANADGFRLHLRGPDDVAILEQAPWWTLRRLLWALGTVGSLTLVSLAWVALLRRRVAAQTTLIGAQIERAAVKDERQRIARELHDTIEQELAGVSLQIRNARLRLANSPDQAKASVELAEKMLRHCRQEARTSIRDLRSVALEQRGLHGAFEETLEPLAAECGADFSFEVQGPPRRLAGPVEIHLLRIANEAVANAARHASPDRISLRLTYSDKHVTLEVKDDGCGFDPSQAAPRGHFGLVGIQERANKLQAHLSLESSPGAGTTIRVVVPATLAARAESHPA